MPEHVSFQLWCRVWKK